MKHFNVESILEDLRKVATTGVIKLTSTMLNKHIIDANKSVIELAESIGINYSDLKAGEKITIEGCFDNSKPCKVSFYKTKTRGDKRFSISGLKKEAAAGDTVAIQKKRNGALVINVSKRATGENQNLWGQSVPALAAMLNFGRGSK
tara:strand:- start:780 stop:1220 length:441 start_codon:yes stop_codon:yes gene_type:complete